MSTARNIKKEQKSDIVTSLLMQGLTRMVALRLAAKMAHWNARGGAFIAIHELFDRVAEETDGYADLLAERMVQLGSPPSATAQDVARHAGTACCSAGFHDGMEYVRDIGGGIGIVADSLRPGIGAVTAEDDAVSADILTEVVRGLDKLRWLVESHLPPR